MRSLRARLLLVSAVVLAGFLGLTGLALDQAFRASAESALRERLQSHLYALLAAADLDANSRLELPVELPEPRFNLVGSGLMAEVRDAAGEPVWRSRSALGAEFAGVSPAAAPGERVFTQTGDGEAPARLMLSFATRWEGAGREPQIYVFHVAERLDEHLAQIRQFRRGLFGWLAAATLLLLVAQALILRWGLAPLRRVAQDLSEMEAGRAQALSGRYPAELQPLIDNLNALLAQARQHLQRYRDTLGNLAHSLKTPLAVLRGSVEAKAPVEELRAVAQEQLQNMNEIVEYQLQRAAAAGRTVLSVPLPVLPPARKLLAALEKVYAAKALRVEIEIAPEAMFRGDEGDLLEILGNVADNAFKWARSRVRVQSQNPAAGQSGAHFTLRIEDDGPGIPDDQAQRVRARGARADTKTPGHGLGLAVVQEIVELYDGELVISRSPLGGAAVEVRL
ncbi:histidine kinase [Sulfuricaulis limicola]|uniref:histidine kinase n=1 Tax=Sulfuricaulis limicola TaxID=1620215 RepID=A0A1B4XJA0_9GAMM|nr:ATP-binding protein [Sulfuricaulis limicola]BAV34877.1 histidine kinase [Sulfuricaulis limicola]